MTTLPKSRILIVDDAPENLHTLLQVFRDEHLVQAATTGEKALEYATSEPPPDIILLDIIMNGMDGYEVCKRLKADIRTKDIPVLFITVLAEASDEAKGLELGALDYIHKPFRPELVRARVNNHLALKHERDHQDQLVEERSRELLLTQQATIECLATLAECRDPDAGGHIKRTQNYVYMLAEQLMSHPKYASVLDQNEVKRLAKSAPLHDIGKVGVPDSILFKPGKLTPKEFKEMERHTTLGVRALLKVELNLGQESYLRYAREIAEHHHERWDGTGYPHGLKEDDIPLSARIMALADVYDALVSKRAYKKPMSHAKALAIIKEHSGTHFDPDVVDAFLKLEKEFHRLALELADHDEEREALKN